MQQTTNLDNIFEELKDILMVFAKYNNIIPVIGYVVGHDEDLNVKPAHIRIIPKNQTKVSVFMRQFLSVLINEDAVVPDTFEDLEGMIKTGIYTQDTLNQHYFLRSENTDEIQEAIEELEDFVTKYTLPCIFIIEGVRSERILLTSDFSDMYMDEFPAIKKLEEFFEENKN